VAQIERHLNVHYAESAIKIPEVRRVLSVMEAAWKSSESGEAIQFE